MGKAQTPEPSLKLIQRTAMVRMPQAPWMRELADCSPKATSRPSCAPAWKLIAAAAPALMKTRSGMSMARGLGQLAVGGHAGHAAEEDEDEKVGLQGLAEMRDVPGLVLVRLGEHALVEDDAEAAA